MYATLLLASLSILLSVAAQFLLKTGIRSVAVKEAINAGSALPAVSVVMHQPEVIFGLAFYVVGAISWLAVLSRWDVSKAYPFVGLGFALTLIVGWMLGESISAMRVFGVLLICIGVGLVAGS